MAGHKGTKAKENGRGSRGSSITSSESSEDSRRSSRSRRGRSRSRERSRSSLSSRSRSKGRDRNKSSLSRRSRSKSIDRGSSPRSSRSVSHSSYIIDPSFEERVDKRIKSHGRINSSDTTIDPSFKERVDRHIKSHERNNSSDTTIRSLGDKYSWEEYVEFLEPLISGVLNKLSKKDITLSREIYKRDPVNITGIEERLKHLSTKGERTIHVGLEMAYGAYKLYELTYENKILKAGKKAHKAAVLFLQAEILRNEGIELLKDSQHKFRRGWNLKKNRRGRTKK